MTHYNVPSMKFSDAPGCPTIDLKVGDIVVDCLMSSPKRGITQTAEILEIWKEDLEDYSVFGLKLDATWLEGLRHPWEIRLVQEFDKVQS